MERRVLRGSYRFESGHFVAAGEMDAINERVAQMRLLADTGDGAPSFYLDPTDATYWKYEQAQDYETTLEEVSRLWLIERGSKCSALAALA